MWTDITISAFTPQPDEATTLFRATTLASTLMEQYMKATATPFVHHALKDTILKIMESKQSCEVKTDIRLLLSHVPLETSFIPLFIGTKRSSKQH